MFFLALVVAIAPIAVGQTATAELSRAFQEELPRALVQAGFVVKPPNEVDMLISERSEFTKCTDGGCLAEEAAYLKAARLILPRLEVSSEGYTVALSLYDAAEKQSIATSLARCEAPTAERLRASVREAARALYAASLRPGTLEVSSVPSARLSIDQVPQGETPWKGEVASGDHVVVLEAGGARVARDVSIAPGRTARLQLTLEAAPHARAHRFRTVKWVTLGLGLVGVAVGGALWGIDGHGTCSLSGAQRQCPRLYDTVPEGAPLVGIGGALAITSVVMFALDR